MSRSHFYPDEKERKRTQEPIAILREIGLGPGMVFVDMGCGEGYFTIPAAEIVGEGGRVYAVDVDPAPIERLEERVSSKGLRNVILKAAKAEDTVLFDSKADIVFFGSSFHDMEDKAKSLGNSMRMIKRGGKVVDLDWRKISTVHGPPLWKRLNEEEVSRLMSDAGFGVTWAGGCGKQHYIIIGVKP